MEIKKDSLALGMQSSFSWLDAEKEKWFDCFDLLPVFTGSTLTQSESV